MNLCRLALAGGLLLATLAAAPAVEGMAADVIGGRAWSVVGPYPSATEADLDRPFPPEAGRDFARALPGADADTWLTWVEAAAGDDLRLLPAQAVQAPAIVYAVTYLETPRPGSVRLAITSAAPHRAWLDGTPYVAGSAAELPAGLHELLVKQRPGSSSDRLRVTCNGPAGLRFLAQRPWPLRSLPTAMWRGLRPADPAALRQQLAQAGGLGLPAIPGAAWTAPEFAGEAVRCAGGAALFLVGQVFFPLKYHLQDYRFRLHGPRPALVLLDGKAMKLAKEEAEAVTYQVASSSLQPGFNRLVIELPAGAIGSLTVAISDPGDLKFAAEVPVQLDPTRPAAAWPAATISNGLISARLALPDDERGLYRGNRFERAGLIAHLSYRGHTFFVGAPERPQPLDPGVCYGPAEEWFEAVAWREARLGEPFLKLGVGWFERPAHPSHQWYSPYWPQAILPWSSRIAGGTAEFTQVCAGPRGWGYRYTKRLVLEPNQPVLRLEHELVNTGSQTISGEQYNHNFLRLDDRAPQAGYRCDFAFAPTPAKDLSRFARIAGNALVLTASPGGQLGSDLTGWQDPLADQAFTVSCAGTPAKVRISGSAALSKLFLFIHPGYLAVEPFVRISVEPGATSTWTRTYTFSVE